MKITRFTAFNKTSKVPNMNVNNNINNSHQNAFKTNKIHVWIYSLLIWRRIFLIRYFQILVAHDNGKILSSNPTQARYTWYNIMWWSLSVTCDRVKNWALIISCYVLSLFFIHTTSTCIVHLGDICNALHYSNQYYVYFDLI